MVNSSEQTRPLIISSGDSSDADGFLTIPIYAKTGADLVFFVNFSAIFDDDHLPATYAALQEEYYGPTIIEPVHAIDKRVHRGNWITAFNDKDMTNYTLLNPNLTKYVDNQNASDENNARNILSVCKDWFKRLQFVFGERENSYPWWLNNLESQRKNTDVIKHEIIKAIVNLNVLMLTELWTQYATPEQKLFIVVKGAANGSYHLNKVNPFQVDQLFDDVDCFYPCIDNVERTIPELQNGDIGYVFQPKQQLKTINSFEKVQVGRMIGLDFNGSFAFLTHHEGFINSVLTKHKANLVVGVMGGVLASEEPKTLSMWNIFRYNCATMNQVYHPKCTNDFFGLLKKNNIFPVITTNNFVNGDPDLDMLGKDTAIEPLPVDRLLDVHQEWLKSTTPSKVPRIIIDIVFQYYGKEAKPMKLFDVAVAMQIAYDLQNRNALNTHQQYMYNDPKQYMYNDPKQGLSIVSTSGTWNVVKTDYKRHLKSKYYKAEFNRLVEEEFSFLDNTKVIQVPSIVLDKGTFTYIKQWFGVKPYTPKKTPLLPQDMQAAKEQLSLNAERTPGFYDLTGKNVLLFSDEEGGAPFNQNDAPFNVRDFGIGVGGGIINQVSDNAALVFLGDVQDNSTYNIRLIQKMLELKEKAKKRVILIAGNRDLNKVRFADDFMLKFNGKCMMYVTPNDLRPRADLNQGTKIQELPKQNNTKDTKVNFSVLVHHILDNQNVCTSYFSYNELTKGLDIKPWHKMNHHQYRQTPIKRATRVYQDLFTAFNGKQTAEHFITQELIELELYKPKKQNSLTTDEPAVVASVFNMFASRCWMNPTITFGKGDDVDTLYNGLYMRYLMACDYCAVFKRGDEYGYVSHAGLSHFNEHLTDVLGLAYNTMQKRRAFINANATGPTIQNASLLDIVSAYAEYKKRLNEFINKAQDSKDNVPLKTFRSEPIIQHAIAMSATSQYAIHKDHVFMHMMSPIVGTVGPHTHMSSDMHKQLFDDRYIIPLTAPTAQMGGHGDRSAALNNALSNKNTLKVARTRVNAENATKNIIKWCVFGHQPRGIVPTVSLAGTQTYGTYYICLDVSKIDGQTNNTSFGVMTITDTEAKKNDVKFYGKVSLTDNALVIYGADGTNGAFTYTKDLEEMVETQKQFRNVALKIPVPDSGEVTKTIYCHVQLKLDKNMYLYSSEFMGTNPGPVIENRLFIVPDAPQITPEFLLKSTAQTTQGGGLRKRTNYQSKTLKELRDACREARIKGFSTMDKAAMIAALKKHKRRAHKKVKRI